MNQALLKKKYGFENPFKPDPLVKKSMQYIDRAKGRVLDVGCGEGADSVFFANKGFQITSIDKSKVYVKRFHAYRKDQKLKQITIHRSDALTYTYRRKEYDVISCILVLCCMKRTEFEKMLVRLKHSVKPGGIVIMSARNYLDPELIDYVSTEKMIEPNTYRKKEDCCRFVYFIEKNRLRELFSDFDVLYYYEGFASCKYNEHPKHGDSYIICKRKR